MKWLCILCLLSSPAFAADAPTVTLTQEELKALIESSISAAFAQQAQSKAKDVYDKINKAFAPTDKKP